MREAVLFTLGETRFGAWKDQLSSVEEVGSLHLLPFLKSHITVLAVIGRRTRTLTDLAAFVGCPPARTKGTAHALILSESEPVQGFLLADEPAITAVGPKAVIALPGYLSVPFVTECVALDNGAIPILDLAALSARVKNGATSVEVSSAAMADCRPSDVQTASGFRAFGAAGSIFVLPEASVSEHPLEELQLLRFPLLPSDIDGIAVSHDRILPMIDLTRRICGENSAGSSPALEARIGDASIAVLVDEDRGLWAREESSVREMPPVARLPWLRSAAVRNGEIASVIDLGEMLRVSRAAGGVIERAPDHGPTSEFPAQFGSGGVRVVEFTAAGHRHAVPESEVAGVIPRQAIRPLPLLPQALCGVSDYDGALLPVVDLARIHGSASRPDESESMLLVVNGGFRALVLAQHVFDAHAVRFEEQRPVPVALPFPVVYGCYTDGDAVRLIFNMESLVSHSEESRLVEIVPAPAPAPAREEVPPASISVGAEEKLEIPSTQAAVEEEPTVIAEMQPQETPTPIEEQPQAPIEPEQLPEETIVQTEPLREPEPAAAVVASTTAPSAPTPRPERTWGRRLLGFVISALVILGAGAGLWLTTDLRTPKPTRVEKPAAEPTQAVQAVETPQVVQTPQAAQAPQAEQTPPVVQAPPAPKPVPVQPQVEAASSYVVKQGDTLWDIANRLTGNPLNYRSIAGRNRIANPDLIFPGQALETTEKSGTPEETR